MVPDDHETLAFQWLMQRHNGVNALEICRPLIPSEKCDSRRQKGRYPQPVLPDGSEPAGQSPDLLQERPQPSISNVRDRS